MGGGPAPSPVGRALGAVLLFAATAATQPFDETGLHFVYPSIQFGLREGLPAAQVLSLYQDRAGALWVGTSGGLAALGGPQIRTFTTDDGLPRSAVTAIAEDDRGRVVAGTPAGAARRDGGRFRPVEGAAAGAVRSFALAPDRSLLVLGSAGLFVLPAREESLKAVPLLGSPQGLEATDIAVSENGDLWVATRAHGLLQFGALADAYRLRRAWTPFGAAAASTEVSRVAARGSAVVASGPTGIARLDDRRFIAAPLPPEVGPGHRAVAIDLEGRMFLGTSNGIFEWRDGRVARVVASQNRARRPVVRLLVDREGQLWSGTVDSGLAVILTGRGVGLLRDGEETFRTVDIDSRGHVWVSSGRAVVRFRERSASFEEVGRARFEGVEPSAFGRLTEDADGSIIVGLDRGVGRIEAADRASVRPVVRPDRRFDALRDRAVTIALRDGDGLLWAGGPSGLFTARGSSPARRAPGLDAESPWTLAEDSSGALILSTRAGNLFRVAAGRAPIGIAIPDGHAAEMVARAPDGGVIAPLEDGSVLFLDPGGAVRAHTPATDDIRHLAALSIQDLGDGVFIGAHGGDRLSQLRLLPTRIEQTLLTSADLEDGDLRYLTLRPGAQSQFWFSLLSGVGRLDPPTQPPTPAALVIDGSPAEIAVEARPNLLSVEPQLSDPLAPTKVLYRSRLAGFADAWSAWSSDPHVRFANLPPGRYTLEVEARDRYGRLAEPLATPVVVAARVWELGPVRAGFALLVLWGARRAYRARREADEDERLRLQAAVRAGREDLERANERLRLASLTDPLSGLHNRRFFSDVVETDLKRLRRQYPERVLRGDASRDAILLLIDLDRFKSINDVYGHAGGDAVLAEAARRFRAALRETDHLIRWGGEEFLVVSLDARRREAPAIAERLMRGLSSAPMSPGLGASVWMTVSIGWSAYPWLADDRDLSFNDVIKLADRALYRAKRAGRNRAIGVLPVTEGPPGDTALLEEFGPFRVSFVTQAGPTTPPTSGPTQN